MPATHPLGLHVHLVGSGPTLRFAIWLERAAEPLAFRTAKYYAGDVPIAHPNAVPHAQAPAWLPKELHPASCLVHLPRLGSQYPVPLPGLITAWDLARFDGRARNILTGPYRVPAWVVPAELSLQPLRALIQGWIARYGAGFASPHAGALLAELGALHARLVEGPLLPTLTLRADRWHAVADAHLKPQNAALTLGWTPPLRLDELNDLRERFKAMPHLAASPNYDFDRRAEERPRTWADDPLPQRFAVFLMEVFSAAVARADAAPKRIATVALREAVIAGATRALHDDHRSCLHLHHGLHAQSEPPKTHLHGRLHPADDGAWDLEVGLTGAGDAFLPVAELVARGVLAHPAVDHDDATWTIPASVILRDWSIAAQRDPLLRAPELLSGRVRVSPKDGARLLAHGTVQGESWEHRAWLASIDAPGRAKAFTAFSTAPATRGAARVRVRWDLLTEGEDSLHAARFVPSVDLAIGDAFVGAAEAEALLAASADDFVRVHGKVIARAELRAAVELLRAREKVLARMDASKGVGLTKVVELDDGWSVERAAAVTESLFSARWEAFLARLREGAGVPLLDAPKGFTGTLRPYQRRGLSWMAFLVARGFGGCLADDMGLGKTVQVLALLAMRREAEPSAAPDLVVCPTAVVRNWARESQRFTPALGVYVHQGADRAGTTEDLRTRLAAADLVVTSYALLRRDAERFEAERWGVLVVDEAQNLKNPDALQTRAAKSLTAHAKLCLSGTPVENQLRDLWSIFDLAIPGLLGGPTRFARAFMGPVKGGDTAALQRLTARVAPFLLRRTKKDPAIAGDLPEKVEQEAWCDLTPEQVTLYQAMTEATLEGIVGKDGVARRAHILGALTRFKQICNHPESFAAEHPDRLMGRSGKLDRALELVEELVAGDQRVLIFTQFTEMGWILQRALAAQLDLDADFYHGGLSAKARDEVLSAFNAPDGPPALIVSLKAGGTGLNLTAASAVIHYDRWWNPAVEDQATDRAHRIGQQRSVNVYKLATRGTLEERVVEMLESKRALAAQVLGGADASFITEMSDRDLRAFLSLGATAEAP